MNYGCLVQRGPQAPVCSSQARDMLGVDVTCIVRGMLTEAVHPPPEQIPPWPSSYDGLLATTKKWGCLAGVAVMRKHFRKQVNAILVLKDLSPLSTQQCRLWWLFCLRGFGELKLRCKYNQHVNQNMITKLRETLSEKFAQGDWNLKARENVSSWRIWEKSQRKMIC